MTQQHLGELIELEQRNGKHQKNGKSLHGMFEQCIKLVRKQMWKRK